MRRRQFLLYGATATLAARLCALPALGQGHCRVGNRRAFAWQDADSRTSVNGIAVAPDGAWFSLEATRPLIDGGPYEGAPWGSLLDLRGEVWLLDGKLDRPRELTRGTPGAWGASFSPDGSRLSALTLIGPGKVGLVVWELRSYERRVISDLNIELFYSTLASDGSAYSAPTGFFQMPKPYVWLDRRYIFAVDRGDALQQSLLAIATVSHTVDALRSRTKAGRASVRLWNENSSTCGAGSRLVKVDCERGESELIYSGDVRGVSLSPNRQWVAVLVAVKHIAPIPNAPMPSALLQTRPGDDLMVVLKLVLVRLAQPRIIRDVQGVMSVGTVAPSRLPVWSVDSSRIAVPVRTTYSDVSSTGDDAVWEVDVESGAARKFAASSALDAELLALLIVTDSLNTPTVRDYRPQRIHNDDYTSVGQISGGAWRCGSQIMFWNAPALSLITGNGMISVPGEFASVQPPVAEGSLSRTLAVRHDGRVVVITTCDDGHRIELFPSRPGWDLLGIRARDAAIVYKDDADTGTFLILATPGRQPHTSPLTFNTYFRNVAKPKPVMLTRKLRDGTTTRALLELPIGHRRGQRHPTIVWAYPGSSPSVGEAFSRPNSDISVVLPVQFLLTQGFAFLHAPFLPSGSTRFEPMQAASDAVLPWLDVLDQQDGIIPGAYGFFGHSNAGYVALSLEALTNRFKAIVAWCTFPEIGYDLHSDAGDVALNCSGNIIQSYRFFYEDPRQPFVPQPAPPWKDPDEYIRNDPLFNLRNATTPLLLVEGEFDSDPQEMESVYSILYGMGVPVELAYYWGEGHVFSSPGNIRDSWIRTERFFGKYLR